MIALNAGEIRNLGFSGVEGSNCPVLIFVMISCEFAPETCFLSVTISFRIMPSAKMSDSGFVTPSWKSSGAM